MRFLFVLCALLVLESCHENTANTGHNTAQPQDILNANRDTAVDPALDFFMYANGGWLTRNPIPEDQSAWGIGNAVQEELYTRLRILNEQSLQATGGIEKKVGDFWHSAM